MKVKVGFVHLHTPLFFAKKNWKEKIDARSSKGNSGEYIEMEYDRETKEMKLSCGGAEAFIPNTNIVSYEPFEKLAPLIEPVNHISANPSINAQVSGPHDHVFAGKGQGQTGLGKKVK